MTRNYNNYKKTLNETSNNGLEELFSLDLPQPEKSVKHFIQQFPVTIHRFYMVEDIRDVGFYLKMINAIRTAEAHDTVFIHLNTRGGNLYTAIQIIIAMRESQATVITCLEGEVCSAGTMIFLAGNQHIVGSNSSFMIHNYSQWLGGKGNEIQLQVKHTESFFKDLADDVYGEFLTKDEIANVLDGRDIWMTSSEVAERVKDKLIDLHKGPEADLNQLLKMMSQGKVEADEEELEEPELEPEPKQVKKATKKKSVAKKTKV